MDYLFFDNASTTRCCDSACELIRRFACEDFGNPSSSHAYGVSAARAIRDARQYFAGLFNVQPAQVIFTGSGSEADNLAVYGVAMAALAARSSAAVGAANGKAGVPAPRVLTSAIEHPAVRKTVQSLSAIGIDAHLLPVDERAQLRLDELDRLLNPQTLLVSVQQVNNIVGSILPIEELARRVKQKVPGALFHTDAVQAFGKVPSPVAHSGVDLLSISGHKVSGPKGIGALIVLNPALLKSGLRPLIWGGEQEGGFRSGTQSAGLIAGFHAAAKEALAKREANWSHAEALRERLRGALRERGLLADDGAKSKLRWNSPADGVPHIVNLSFPGYPSGPLAKLLEERRCLVSTGSACSSGKVEPDAVLTAMGVPQNARTSAIRISFSADNRPEDVDTLATAIAESVQLMEKLLGITK